MLGRVNFGKASLRLQQINNNKLPFGGVDVVLVGDLAQLPPVKDKPKYDESACTIKGLEAETAAGIAAYQLFKDVVFLERPYRQEEEDTFFDLLQRLREGQQTKEDWETLKLRHLHKLQGEELERFQGHTCLRLCATREAAATHNESTLTALRAPIVTIVATHNTDQASRITSAELYGGLETVVRLAVGARVSLKRNSWLFKGLFNGAMGWVRAILYCDGHHPSRLDHPQAVVVEFDSYTGPGFDDRAGHVAVPMQEQPADERPHLMRTQIPLQLAWATTIHKVQGFTFGKDQPVESYVMNLSRREFAAGLTFVGTSRARSLDALALNPMPDLQRFHTAGKGLQANARKNHEKQQRVYAQATEERLPELKTNQLQTLLSPSTPATSLP